MATIKDVAKLAGVGVGTVSRVLSGKGSVSAKTLLKVNNAMKALNYKPNRSARSLKSKKFNTIGIWGTDTSGELERKTLRDIEQQLKPYDVHCIITNGDLNTPSNPNAAKESVELLIDKGCDGIIIWGSDIDLTELDILQIATDFPNIILLNNKVDLISDKCIYYDHHQAGFIAGQYLIDHGHRNIACITGWLRTADAIQRHQGFLDALNNNNISIPAELIFNGDYTFSGGYRGAKHLLKQDHSFTALFCGNDQSAMSAIAALSSAGYNVPDDISVLGYDDMNIAPYTNPPLTTMHVPFNKMVVTATRQLLNLCYKTELSIDHDFPVQLIERQSVNNINNK